MDVISSLDNNRIKEICKLKDKKYRDITNSFLIEGLDLIEEAKKNGYLDCVITDKEYDFNNVIYVTPVIMKKISFLESPTNYIGVVKKVKEQPISGKVLILDNISDPGNLGTIIRSSVAFNIDTIVLSDDSVDLYNEKVIRSTKGMIFNINIVRKNIFEVIKDLKNNNYTIVGTSLDNSISVSELVPTNKIALIVGNEGQGIKKEVLEITDYNVKIDINAKCESLNVGVATSILLYEINRWKI